MSPGSIQLRRYRIARRDDADREAAAALSGIALAEAKLIDADDAREPPPPEAFLIPAAGCAASHERPVMADLLDDTSENEDLPDTENPIVALAADTLRGDIRDSLLAWFKAQPKHWSMMSEAEQRNLADSADRYSRTLVKDACQIIAAAERPCIVATLVEYKEKDGVEAKLKLASKGEVVAAPLPDGDGVVDGVGGGDGAGVALVRLRQASACSRSCRTTFSASRSPSVAMSARTCSCW